MDHSTTITRDVVSSRIKVAEAALETAKRTGGRDDVQAAELILCVLHIEEAALEQQRAEQALAEAGSDDDRQELTKHIAAVRREEEGFRAQLLKL